jgi:hypothetical protein
LSAELLKHDAFSRTKARPPLDVFI